MALMLGPSGGVGGVAFDDGPFPEGARLRELRVWGTECIEGLQIVLDLDGELVERPRRGTASAGLGVLRLAEDEHVTEVYGRYSGYVDQLSVRTAGGQIRRFGGRGGACDFAYFAPAGFHIVGFWGRAGRLIDALGVHLAGLD